MKTLMTGTAVALMLSGAAYAADMKWNDWDTNADARLDQNEFNAGFDADGMFGGWDADADGMLSQEEFNTGFFGSMDTTGDGFLDEPEGVTLDAVRTGWDADRSR